MNTYSSSLIEEHDTRPRALRIRSEVDRMRPQERFSSLRTSEFIQRLHREFHQDAPELMLRILAPEANSR